MIEKTKESKIYKLYMGIGLFAIAFLFICIIFAVIMRYIFNISFAFLEEFVTTLFAFSTFWGIGICIIEDEHVIIDTFYDKLPLKIKRVITFINYVIVLIVNIVMVRYGFDYALEYGVHFSMGMKIPMIWMYGIIPLCSAIGAVCTLIKLVTIAKAPLSYFEKKILKS